MAADTRVKADTVDDLLGIQTLALGVGVQLIEVRHAQRQIGVGKQLDSLGLGEAHEQRVDVFLDSSLLQQPRKGVRGLHQARVVQVSADNDAARVKVVVERLRLAQELGAEYDVAAAEFFAHRHRVAHGNRRLDDHDGVGVVPHDKLNDRLDSRGVKVLGAAVVVCGRGDDDKVRAAVRLCRVKCGGQFQFLFGQVFFNVFVPDRRFAPVDEINLGRDHVNRADLVVLRQQRCNGKSHIACSRNRNFKHFVHSRFLLRVILAAPADAVCILRCFCFGIVL